MQVLKETDFEFKGQKSVYHGKVRDVYNIEDKYMVMVATDRISAFDVVLPEGIPYKGQVLNQIAEFFLDSTKDIVPNWKLACPDPMVTVGLCCEPLKIEMIVHSCLKPQVAPFLAQAKGSCPFWLDSLHFLSSFLG